MKTLLHLLLFVLPLIIKSQPTISNAEDYTPGTSFDFIDCNTGGVAPGNAGANVTWNFSGLTSAGGTITTTVLSPSAVPSASMHPAANLVLNLSSGYTNYLLKNGNSNLLVGMKENSGSFSMSYTDPALGMKRPVTYGTLEVDTFKNTFTAGGFNFIGKGTSMVTGDAYGTLILPTKTYSNVLRVKIFQVEKDSLIQFGSVSTTTYVTFLWFNGINESPLLSIDSMQSSSPQAPQVKTVKYIINDTVNTTAIGDVTAPKQLQFYPNPASNSLMIINEESTLLEITDLNGKTVNTFVLEKGSTEVPLQHYPPGVYLLRFHTDTSVITRKLLIRR